jgi:hypothetical protein
MVEADALGARGMTPHLAAFCVNATSTERAEVAFAIVHETSDGEWEDALGNLILPFWVEPINLPEAQIPEGWIEHLHRQNTFAKRFNLEALLPKAPVYRRF